MITVHTNPLAEPGAGDAGGMNVYVQQVARALAARGVEVDVFCRRDTAA
ncbi:MAG TPA: glycosyltransferase, partial [Actinomycetota bacterium]